MAAYTLLGPVCCSGSTSGESSYKFASPLRELSDGCLYIAQFSVFQLERV